MMVKFWNCYTYNFERKEWHAQFEWIAHCLGRPIKKIFCMSIHALSIHQRRYGDKLILL